MITVSRKSIDASIAVFAVTMFVTAVVMIVLASKVVRDIDSIRNDLAVTVDNVDKINEDTWLLSPQYDVWIASSSEANNLTSKLIAGSPGGGLQALKYSIQRGTGAPLIVYYLTNSGSIGLKTDSGKNPQFSSKGMATIDSIINVNVRDKLNPEMHTVIVTDPVASSLIDSTKDVPIKKVVSISTTPTEPKSTSATKSRDVKVVEYN